MWLLCRSTRMTTNTSEGDFQKKGFCLKLSICLSHAASTRSVGTKNQCRKQVYLYALWCVSDYALVANTSHCSQRADRPRAQVSCCKMELDKVMEEVVWHGAKKNTGTNFTSDVLSQPVYYSGLDIKWQRWHFHQNETEYNLTMAKSIILEFCCVTSL